MNLLDLWLRNPLLVGFTVICFIILDNILTRKANENRKKKHIEYFETSLYEANPFHQKTIHEGHTVQKRDISLDILLIFLSFILSFAIMTKISKEMGEFGLGMIVFIYVNTLLGHLRHLLEYQYTKTNPNSLEGKIKISKSFSYAIQRRNLLIDSLFILFLFILEGRVFFLGGAIMLVILFLITFSWEKKSDSN
ncbi:MAG: hypothetical protein ACW98F_18800 [Candidatus Hodarchaeales archaeon]|jgi:uncharacterized membrane protein